MIKKTNEWLMFTQHATTAQFVDKVSAWVAGLLQQAIADKGKATLVVSGGSTPVPVFTALAKYLLPWRQVKILLADERWLPPEHKDSNTCLVQEHLLTGPAAAANFLPFPYSGDDILGDAADMDRRLAAFKEPFDLVLLGMGDDGHTASLFPDATELEAGLCGQPNVNSLALTPVDAPHRRLSLTLPRLLCSKQIGLLLQGQSKLAVYQQALSENDIKAMPIRGVLQQQRVPVSVHWCPSS